MREQHTSGNADLSTAQSVDRRLVHRSALAEVFLTDYRYTGASSFLALAQLPPAHSYFSRMPMYGVRGRMPW